MKHETYDYEANHDKLVDSRGVRLTTNLFEELNWGTTGVTPVFKLSDWHKKYVEVSDPTEYAAALVLIGSWEHWNLLLGSNAFLEHVMRWRNEVEIKIRSEAIVQITKQAKLPTGTAAAKWLAEAGFALRDKRSTKSQKLDEDNDKAARANVAQDAKRLGLTAVK